MSKMVYSNDGKLYHIQVAPGEVGKYVILPGDPKRCKAIAKYFDDPAFLSHKAMLERDFRRRAQSVWFV